MLNAFCDDCRIVAITTDGTSMYQKKTPLKRRPANVDVNERIDELRQELAELEVRQRGEVEGKVNASRPGAAGKLTLDELFDLGIILQESISKGRELTQTQHAKLLGEQSSKALNNRLNRLEERLGDKLYRTKDKNRSGEMTFEGWEFAMIGILLRELVILEEGLAQHKFEYILRRLVWSLRSERMWAFERLDPDSEPTGGLGKIAAGIRGFHWLDAIFPPVETPARIPLDDLPERPEGQPVKRLPRARAN